MSDLISIIVIIVIVIIIIALISYTLSKRNIHHNRRSGRSEIKARNGNVMDRFISEKRRHSESDSNDDFISDDFSNNDNPCPQISAPVITVSYNSSTGELDVSWTNSAADTYTIEVIAQTNSNDIKINDYIGNQIYIPVPLGTYTVFVTPVNGNCFGPTGRSAFNTPCFPACTGATPICNGTACVECLNNTDCPTSTPVCNVDTCVECLSNTDCPSATPVCNGTTCVQCLAASDCLPDANCVATVCVCPIPVVTGITIGADWSTPSPWTFNVTGAGIGTARFTFGWKVYGTAGPTMPPVSGYSSGSVPLPNNQFLAQTVPQIWTCNNSLGYGCSNAGCSAGDTVTFSIDHLVVVNGCGQSSASTCWVLANPCPGGSLSFVQVPC